MNLAKNLNPLLTISLVLMCKLCLPPSKWVIISLSSVRPLWFYCQILRFSCQRDADLTYIGKTKRHLTTRVNEHLAFEDRNKKSEVKTHIMGCETCRAGHIGLDSFKVVRKCQNSYDVLIHEALSIKKQSPKLNKQLFRCGSFYTCKIYWLSQIDFQ